MRCSANASSGCPAFRSPTRHPRTCLPVAPLPASSNGYVTFGHFGRTERLNDSVIATWARILHAVPRSRLILDNRPFQEAAFRDLFLARFASHGIDPARLDLVYSTPQSSAWAAYGGIDIALDPFPHNAGTTTIEALWQGVPVVTLAGRPTVGRFGASILHAVGLDDWITERHRRLCGARRGGRNRPRRARAIACGTSSAGRRVATARRSRPRARHRAHISNAMERMAGGRRRAPASPLHRGQSNGRRRLGAAHAAT